MQITSLIDLLSGECQVSASDKNMSATVVFVRAKREDAYAGLRDAFVPVNKRVKRADGPRCEDDPSSLLVTEAARAAHEEEHPLLPRAPFTLVPRARVMALLRWPGVAGIGAGLRNVGNTCYLNCVLQCLTYTPPLANFAASQEHTRRCAVQGFCSLCALCRLVLQLQRSSGVVTPTAFVSNLRVIAPDMRPGRPEDAHEFLRLLLDSAQGVLEREAVGRGPSQGGAAKRLPPHVAETSWLGQMFGGYLANVVQCSTCGFESRRCDPFLDLSLEVMNCSTLEDCLAQFTRCETIGGTEAWNCERCKQKRTATKRMTLLRTPPVLTLKLKLFTPQGAKRFNKSVRFEAGLDLSPYMTNDAPVEPQKYSLYATVVHTGRSTSCGHYTAFVKASNGVWYGMDDGSVRQVQLATVLKTTPQMLFYVRNVDAPKRAAQVPAPAPERPAPEDGGGAAVPVVTTNPFVSAIKAPAALLKSIKKKEKKDKKEKKKRKKDAADVAAAALPPAAPAAPPVSDDVVGFLERTESVRDFEAWEATDIASKKLAILQQTLKDKLMARKRVGLLDPELDKGRVKKIRRKAPEGATRSSTTLFEAAAAGKRVLGSLSTKGARRFRKHIKKPKRGSLKH